MSTNDRYIKDSLDAPVERPLEERGKMPTFLIVLLILTSLNCLMNLGSNGLSMAFDVNDQVQEDTFTEMFEELSEQGGALEAYQADFEDFALNFLENARSYATTQFFYFLLVTLGVVLMFMKKISGLYLYLILQVVAIFFPLLFFGNNILATGSAIVIAVWNLIWSIMYWSNRDFFKWN